MLGPFGSSFEVILFRGMNVPLSNAPLNELRAFNAFDWLLVTVLVWSFVTALLRGIIRELFGLAGMLLGLLLACWYYPPVAVWLSRWITSPVAASLTAFLVLVGSVMIASTVLGRMVRGTAHTIGLGFVDRVAGGAFGLVRGCLVGVVILMAATAFLPPQTTIANSRLAPYFLAAAREVCFVVPQDLRQQVSHGIDSIRHLARR